MFLYEIYSPKNKLYANNTGGNEDISYCILFDKLLTPPLRNRQIIAFNTNLKSAFLQDIFLKTNLLCNFLQVSTTAGIFSIGLKWNDETMECRCFTGKSPNSVVYVL